MLNVRQIEEKDLPVIYGWAEDREDWSRAFPPTKYLPESGLGGVIVSHEDIPFVVGYLYFNPAISFIEWIMSDKSYKGEDRADGVKLCIKALEKAAYDLGANSVFTITKNKRLMEKFEDCGYHIDETPSNECIKFLR